MRRRNVISGLGSLIGQHALAANAPRIDPGLPDGTRAEAHMVKPPDKQPLLQLSDRPLILESPIQYLRPGITANDQFFVRYHLPGLPEQRLLDNWTLTVRGDATTRDARLTDRDLRDLPQAEVVAVCQPAGYRRGLLNPHVAGVQWGHGAVGCAIWHGPRLRDILAVADTTPEALEVWFDCPDQPAVPGSPRYRKSLPMSKAMADETIVATSMNGSPVPPLNGYPARLVVGGWVSDYWVKHLTGITVSTKPLNEYWMAGDCRVPKGLFGASGFESQENATSAPVTDLRVNALITSPTVGDEVERSGFTVTGVAWDGGSGILRIDVSLDGGKTWQSAFLERERGPYAFQNFKLDTGPLPRGPTELVVKARSNAKETQPDVWPANPGGYHNNVPQRVAVKVV